MNKVTLTLLLTILSIGSYAQYDRIFEPLFEERPGYPKSGWIVGLGATYNITTTDERDVLLKDTPDSLFYGSYRSSSLPGLYAEVGRFTNFREGIIFNQIDYGVNFKQMIHHQEFAGYLKSPSDLNADSIVFNDPEAKYNDLNIGVHFNASRFIQLSDYHFIMPSIGIHGDFRVGGKKSYELFEEVAAYRFPEKNLQIALHAKLAWGVKLTRETFLVPSIEVQLNKLFVEEENKGIGVDYFHSSYNPIIFAVKYYIHRPQRRNDCAEFDNRVNLERKRRRKTGRQMF